MPILDLYSELTEGRFRVESRHLIDNYLILPNGGVTCLRFSFGYCSFRAKDSVFAPVLAAKQVMVHAGLDGLILNPYEVVWCQELALANRFNKRIRWFIPVIQDVMQDQDRR